jgi:hypothetical protein
VSKRELECVSQSNLISIVHNGVRAKYCRISQMARWAKIIKVSQLARWQVGWVFGRVRQPGVMHAKY